jgi:hypothetical protein
MHRMPLLQSSHARRAASCGVVIAIGTVLSSCSPSNISGVKLSNFGTPVLVNCGTFFRGVEAYDAATGTLVWSAHAQDSSEGGVAEVEVGILPAQDWIEVSPPQMDDVPATWRLVVANGSDSALTIEVATANLSQDRVFVPAEKKSVSLADFRRSTCDGVPALLFLLSWGLPIVGVAAILIALIYTSRRRPTLVPDRLQPAGVVCRSNYAGSNALVGWTAVDKPSSGASNELIEMCFASISGSLPLRSGLRPQRPRTVSAGDTRHAVGRLGVVEEAAMHEMLLAAECCRSPDLALHVEPLGAC